MLPAQSSGLIHDLLGHHRSGQRDQRSHGMRAYVLKLGIGDGHHGGPAGPAWGFVVFSDNSGHNIVLTLPTFSRVLQGGCEAKAGSKTERQTTKKPFSDRSDPGGWTGFCSAEQFFAA